MKKIFIELSMNHFILKKAGTPAAKYLTQEIDLDPGLSVTVSCKLTHMYRSQYYYISKKNDSLLPRIV
ncbi:hypothetical protein [Sphingobacterium sp. BIGb0116]|uniref:hypothetical protein n=1 Tax=Sphingobacterium sp. BIGb0116 TaxID=2940619 RepID=UPI002169FE72|nr:hypothetical protein [Sphingobacterium sp. BIGb0116]MCS4166377.1 hypothetical protein [Sphingobacterium sp. BIGb0116]